MFKCADCKCWMRSDEEKYSVAHESEEKVNGEYVLYGVWVCGGCYNELDTYGYKEMHDTYA